MRRSLALRLLSGTLAVTATAFLLIQVVWRREPWATYACGALFVIGAASLILQYRLKDPTWVFLGSVLSPDWKRMAVGLSLLLAAFPWTMIVGLGVRHGILPDSLTTAVVLLIPLAALLITGLYNLVWGFLARK